MGGFTLFKYDGTDLVSPEGSTEGTTCDNLEVLLLGDLLGYLDGIYIGTNFGNEIGFSDEKVLCTTLEDIKRLSLGKYDGTALRSLEG